jgi:NAD(P)-dependent dehydrogenase (short-subunit alcohol dehydrogenase family)
VILAGKRALVTGGAGGIGSAIVRLFAAEGAEVVVHDLPQSEGAALAASAQATFIAGDLCDTQALLADVARAGPLDILVNNAAIDPIGPIERYDGAAYDETQAINARAAFLLCQAVVPGMKQRGGGAIVNIMSVTLSGGWADKVPYVMSKGALLGLTRALAREVGPAGIRVNAVSPGAIPTGLERKFWGHDRAAFDRTVIEQQPLKFRGSPEDIAEATLFLASPRSRFITGHELHVNGGWYMG